MGNSVGSVVVGETEGDHVGSPVGSRDGEGETDGAKVGEKETPAVRVGPVILEVEFVGTVRLTQDNDEFE